MISLGELRNLRIDPTENDPCLLESGYNTLKEISGGLFTEDAVRQWIYPIIDMTMFIAEVPRGDHMEYSWYAGHPTDLTEPTLEKAESKLRDFMMENEIASYVEDITANWRKFGMKLKPEVKEAWVKHLRSGEYKQGTRYLCYKIDGIKEFCCLGVFCEVQHLQKYVIASANFNYDFPTTSSCSKLPPEYFETFFEQDGQDETIRLQIVENIQNGFIKFNDSYELNFQEIAEIIQKNL